MASLLMEGRLFADTERQRSRPRNRARSPRLLNGAIPLICSAVPTSNKANRRGPYPWLDGIVMGKVAENK